MAGITLLYQHEQIAPAFLKKIENELNEKRDLSILLREKEFILLKKAKENYPVHITNHQDYTLIIEGKIYGVDMLSDKDFIRYTKSLLFNKKKEDSLRYIRNLDGEFVIYLIDNLTKKMVIVNDYLGRLPVYYIRNDHFVLGRDISVIQKISKDMEFSEAGVYQYMRLGYPLGDKTLYENLYRLPPSSCVEIDACLPGRKGNINIQNQPVSLTELHESRGKNNNPEEQLYEHFKSAMKRRFVSNEKIMLSLSGGLDSRIIMGEIEKESNKVSYESFHYENSIIESDLAVVRKLCDYYGKQFNLTELKEWSPEYFNELIDIKKGMNYLGMAFLIPFLKEMSSNYNLMLTGDGGDKTLPYLFLGLNLFNRDITTLILSRNEVTSQAGCKQIFHTDSKRNEDEIRAYFNAYNEKYTGLNYKRFLLFERTKNWLFEGEDRNRNYIWSTSPFYNPEFFRAAHSINENYKKNYRLYSLFNNLIDPGLNTIPNANWDFPINNEKKLKYLLTKQAIKHNVGRLFPRRSAPHTIFVGLLNEIKTLLAKGVGEPLNVNIALDLKTLSNESLFHLLTLLKVAELIEK